jgi:hypothetical protein
MNLYDATVPVFTKFLGGIEKWLDKAAAYADTKKFDPEILMQARLAPDQYPFINQVQSACDMAKFCAAKLTGKEAPSHPDSEKTIPELRARIRTVLDYLKTFKPEEFVGAEDRLVKHTWMPSSLKGGDYLDHFLLPNFHFHLVTAYAILRHNGVDLGKMDFIQSLPFQKS